MRACRQERLVGLGPVRVLLGLLTRLKEADLISGGPAGSEHPVDGQDDQPYGEGDDHAER